MQEIKEDKLIAEIKAKRFSNIYIIFGNDSYLKKYYCDKISENCYGGDKFFNLQKFSGDIDFGEVFDAVNQFPMMAQSKCVVIDDFDYSSAKSDDLDKFCKIFAEVPETCHLICRFDAMEFDTKYDSKAAKIAKAAEKANAVFVCLDHRNEASLVRMLTNGAKKRECILNDKTARYLIETVGFEINILRNELNKLCNFVSQGEISEDTIDKVCIKSVQGSVYDYVAAISGGDLQKALSILNNMLYMRFEPIIILFNVSNVYVDMLRMFTAMEHAVDKTKVAADFAYNRKAFLLDRAKKNLRNFNLSKLNESFDVLINTDKKLKSYNANANIILEEMTVKLNLILWGD